MKKLERRYYETVLFIELTVYNINLRIEVPVLNIGPEENRC